MKTIKFDTIEETVEAVMNYTLQGVRVKAIGRTEIVML